MVVTNRITRDLQTHSCLELFGVGLSLEPNRITQIDSAQGASQDAAQEHEQVHQVEDLEMTLPSPMPTVLPLELELAEVHPLHSITRELSVPMVKDAHHYVIEPPVAQTAVSSNDGQTYQDRLLPIDSDEGIDEAECCDETGSFFYEAHKRKHEFGSYSRSLTQDVDSDEESDMGNVTFADDANFCFPKLRHDTLDMYRTHDTVFVIDHKAEQDYQDEQDDFPRTECERQLKEWMTSDSVQKPFVEGHPDLNVPVQTIITTSDGSEKLDTILVRTMSKSIRSQTIRFYDYYSGLRAPKFEFIDASLEQLQDSWGALMLLVSEVVDIQASEGVFDHLKYKDLFGNIENRQKEYNDDVVGLNVDAARMHGIEGMLPILPSLNDCISAEMALKAYSLSFKKQVLAHVYRLSTVKENEWKPNMSSVAPIYRFDYSKQSNKDLLEISSVTHFASDELNYRFITTINGVAYKTRNHPDYKTLKFISQKDFNNADVSKTPLIPRIEPPKKLMDRINSMYDSSSLVTKSKAVTPFSMKASDLSLKGVQVANKAIETAPALPIKRVLNKPVLRPSLPLSKKEKERLRLHRLAMYDPDFSKPNHTKRNTMIATTIIVFVILLVLLALYLMNRAKEEVEFEEFHYMEDTTYMAPFAGFDGGSSMMMSSSLFE